LLHPARPEHAGAGAAVLDGQRFSVRVDRSAQRCRRPRALLVERARGLGHERFVYLGHGRGPESYVDRAAGFDTHVGQAGTHVAPEGDPHEWIRAIEAARATVVFVEQDDFLHRLVAALDERGLSVPEVFSLVSLSGSIDAPDGLTGFRLPRREMGRLAVDMLSSPADHPRQSLLSCELVEGRTLARVGS
jgi:DNA-binding LacI/PurR family transcriptional regulator